MSRELTSLEKRRSFHQQRLAQARTPRERFWKAAAWLLVEAIRAGRLREATGWVLERVEEMQATTRYPDVGEHRAS